MWVPCLIIYSPKAAAEGSLWKLRHQWRKCLLTNLRQWSSSSSRGDYQCRHVELHWLSVSLTGQHCSLEESSKRWKAANKIPHAHLEYLLLSTIPHLQGWVHYCILNLSHSFPFLVFFSLHFLTPCSHRSSLLLYCLFIFVLVCSWIFSILSLVYM